MGNCASSDRPPILVDLESLHLADGELVLLKHKREGPSYISRINSWEAFQSTGFIVTSRDGEGQWDVILTSPTSALFQRLPLQNLLNSHEIADVGVANITAFDESDIRRIRNFTDQLERGRRFNCGERVQLISGRGRKVFVARVVAEMLAATGRFVRLSNGSTYAPNLSISKMGGWYLPDPTYIRLPGRPAHAQSSDRQANKLPVAAGLRTQSAPNASTPPLEEAERGSSTSRAARLPLNQQSPQPFRRVSGAGSAVLTHSATELPPGTAAMRVSRERLSTGCCGQQNCSAGVSSACNTTHQGGPASSVLSSLGPSGDSVHKDGVSVCGSFGSEAGARLAARVVAAQHG